MTSAFLDIFSPVFHLQDSKITNMIKKVSILLPRLASVCIFCCSPSQSNCTSGRLSKRCVSNTVISLLARKQIS